MALLEVQGLSTHFMTDGGIVRAVDDVSFSLEPGETLGVVGESGSGKSVTMLSILRLIQEPPGKIAAGRVLFDGQDLLELGPRRMRRIRGSKIAMIFQDPMTSLNPFLKVSLQITEGMRLHRGLSKRDATRRAIELLEMVGIPKPAERIDQYPHQFSGGQRQRIMIAIALSCEPKILIADEPTTALDVTIQAQILDLLTQLQEEMGMAILLITHNLGVVAHFARDVAVLYAGKLVEHAGVRELFAEPQHPYTRALLRALPRPGREQEPLAAIAGTVPSPLDFPAGCAFHDRCAEVLPRCPHDPPPLTPTAAGHEAACWLHHREETP